VEVLDAEEEDGEDEPPLLEGQPRVPAHEPAETHAPPVGIEKVVEVLVTEDVQLSGEQAQPQGTNRPQREKVLLPGLLGLPQLPTHAFQLNQFLVSALGHHEAKADPVSW
jgi:hypothetical protein